ncbi:DUF1015 domain-containing protein [Streptomyces sp. A3M-1-3]|uniref:DUF1015 domain-containing protein n=1 Tax=Streptomyces sp. A3M-1-3 TaxID=2962044 RepID=UPI0020B6B6C1|nr:DUF1015 domain-containing protein [Streptomyces sp. A3M-1-3]MCP3820874.1 DUF1015 domain-containing protein [Streptomyces sp. A3M-1-3]
MPTPATPPARGLRLRPFRAVRYDPATAGELSNVICPPYDDVGSSHARALRRRPHHLARLLYSSEPQTAAGQLERWLQRGVLVRDSLPALYVYQQQLGAKVLHRGVIGELDLPTGTPAAVLPHEDVQAHVVGQRAAHMEVLRAQLEPLLLTYRAAASSGSAAVEGVTRRRPLAVARIGRITHSVWACTDLSEQAAITGHLAGASALIADGHHRYAACLRLGEQQPRGPWGQSLALLVDQATHPLQLTAIHRVIPGLEPDKALAAAADVMRVRPLPGGARQPLPGELVLTTGGHAWVLTDPDPRSLDEALAGQPTEWRDLPTAVADHLLLNRTWSVPDLPGAVRHVHDAHLATASAVTPGHGIAVLLPAVSEKTVRTLAGAGVLLPRKTTSFGPKPAAGLALRVLGAP